MVREVAAALREEAESVNERRMLVLTGSRETCLDAANDALSAAAVPRDEATHLGTVGSLDCERVHPRNSDDLLGTTRTAVVYDAHDECRPNALGRIAGAVDGGGLLLLLAPALDDWPRVREDFDEGLAVPPFSLADVTGHFRRRLVDTLRAHPGISIYDADTGTLERDGRTRPAPRSRPPPPESPADHDFPERAYDACLTQDQVDAVHALEALRETGEAVVVEADRGRGKSSAAGIAAACLADEGLDVLVTAPRKRSASELFERADELGCGGLRFEKPPAAADLPGNPDVVFVDEAAALPVRLLEDFLDADRVAFTTTVHGYEGAGRGFDVRFRDRLADSDLDVVEARMSDPIRYAAGDPVEVWAFRALLLDARPPVTPLVADAAPEDATYDALTSEDLLADETLLREAFGLLVYAHYRTEPNDLARLLDAPNLSVRALRHDGHVVSVALLAREGGLDRETREEMYTGGRILGNMIPDVLTSQLRDENAAVPVGWRVVRIATHHAARSRGFGGHLLDELRNEITGDLDWLGVGYGATPELVSFWDENGFDTVHVSTTRNDTSGEYSAIMLDPLSEAGTDVHDHHAAWFADRIPDVLGDALADLDADVARACLAAADAPPALSLSDHQWRVVVGASYGPGLYAADPAPFRALAAHHLTGPHPDLLTPREERLLVRKLLQTEDWDSVAADLDYHSTGQCMRALGGALEPLVDEYGTPAAHEDVRRYD
ncbi:tRNA(Met) cytidine acetyltransferase TmcA [Salarchaeum sp. JOR-1]|uniref:tRNA(Met) cytidine acetyltransferase TmcA n=1 Tax=Salarchaeum sp. JOR-1 TaxID=2599399 RepID=UPI0011982B56|nr:tRNA(Met) cytidine acetyltransferase TmcA [Salarchaeum sp. JOR-1]QDX40899.1 tRNA(Met) cytidine acetyltransferase [Salarchaeum sp. JOR-1]